MAENQSVLDKVLDWLHDGLSSTPATRYLGIDSSLFTGCSAYFARSTVIPRSRRRSFAMA